ncbi:hypothetical protein I4U23_001595 [Adineta vaga]|nr:hypothetical protein I4U23_001595 [Adineta vaga]
MFSTCTSNSSDNTCDQTDTICVQHPRCNHRPLCYPVSMIDKRVCPSTTINTTTTTIPSTTTPMTTTTITDTPQQPLCMNSSLITFENSSTFSQIPDGYYGLNWFNAYIIDIEAYPQYAASGFYSAETSGTGVATNYNGDSMTIRIPLPNKFNINSFVVSSAWDDNVTFSIIAQRGSTYYKEASFNIEKNSSNLIELNWYDVNTVTFYASKYNNREKAVFMIDNLCVDVTTDMNSSSPGSEIIDRCPLNEAFFQDHCHYLDGTNGECADGYSLGSDTLLSRVANLFIGLNYKTRISRNCCVYTSDTHANYGFGIDQCNKQGPFQTAPDYYSGGCRNFTNKAQGQLTFCVSN